MLISVNTKYVVFAFPIKCFKDKIITMSIIIAIEV